MRVKTRGAWLIFVLAISSLIHPVFAQDATPVPAETLDDAAAFRSFLQEGLAPYRVVYVAAPEDEAELAENYLGAAYLTETFGIIYVESLEAAQAEDESDPIHAIIVTSLALEDASEEGIDWLQNGYRHGLIVAFVNVTFSKHLTTLGIEECPGERAIPLVDYPTDWVAVYEFYILGDPEDVGSVIRAYDQCQGDEDNTELQNLAYGTVGSSNTEMNDFRGGLISVEILLVSLRLRTEMQNHFEMQ